MINVNDTNLFILIAVELAFTIALFIAILRTLKNRR